MQEIAILAASICELTKRIATSIISKFFDHIGFFSPIVVKLKMFFKYLYEKD